MINRPSEKDRTIGALTKRAYEMAKSKGFHDETDHDPAHWLTLITGELSEAFEELRDGHGVLDVYYSYAIELHGHKIKNLSEYAVEELTGSTPADLGLTPKPEGFGMEIADTVIRIFHLAGLYGIDLESMVLEKMDYNSTREKRHGRKF